jgi:hypothetical protein
LFAKFWVSTIPEKVLEREREKCLTLILGLLGRF